jgi:hypothetical protein
MERIRLPDGTVKTVYPPGPNGGVIKPFKDRRDPSITHWIEVFETDEGDLAAERELCLRDAAAFMRVSPKTLYKYGPHLRSFRKVHGFDFFDMKELSTIDVPYLSGFRSFRRAIDAENKALRDAGVVRRRGRHIDGCPRDHEGKCLKHRTPGMGAHQGDARHLGQLR